MDYEQSVGKKLLIITDDPSQEMLKKSLVDEGFAVVLLSPSMILDIDGHIGNLEVTLKKTMSFLICRRIRLFGMEKHLNLLWSKVAFYIFRLLDLKKALEKVRHNEGSYHYKNYISYDPSICQYHERRVEVDVW